MKSSVKIGAGLLFAMVAVMLAGCGNHDQNSPSATGGTPPDVVQNSKNQAQGMQSHPPPAAQGAPTAPATH